MARSDAKKIFTRIYARNSWRDVESRSGPGSVVGRTGLLRSRLSELVSELGVRSLLDVPCGDFNWIRLTEWPGVEYLGADVVAELVRANTLLYGRPGIKFAQIDMLRAAEAGRMIASDGRLKPPSATAAPTFFRKLYDRDEMGCVRIMLFLKFDRLRRSTPWFEAQ